VLASAAEMKAYGLVFGLLMTCVAAPAWGQSDSDLSAGGLAPPDAIESEGDRAAREQQTEAELEEAEREDSGRGLEFFWLNGEIGVTHMGLQALKGDGLVDPSQVETQQTGLTYGGGLGARLVFITIGGRFRMATFSEWQLWTANLEVGLRIPVGSLEPYFTLGGGYASLGSFAGSGVSSEASAAGFDIRGGFGVDYYLTPMFSLGGNLTGDLLFLSRSAVSGAPAGDVYAESGSGIGAGGTLTLVVGLHF
jgi:hypothetical protein